VNYNKFIAEKILKLRPSGIRKFFDIASEMENAVSLGVGEPDFLTPWNIREAGVYSLEKGRTTYSANAGILELRIEISKYLKNKFELEYDPKKEILVTVGASEGVDLAMRALINPGDEILYQEPCFVSYRPCIEMAGGIPVPIVTKAENGFKVTPEEIAANVSPKTKAILISYPNNPTGGVMEREDLEKIAGVIIKNNLIVVSDEIYAELTYLDKRHASVAEIPGLRERTILINGFSKAFSMTGWRLGFLAAPEELSEQLIKIHQYILMCAPTTSQYAGIEALKNSAESVQKMKTAYNARRNVMVKGFRDMGLPVFEPLGAFYVFPSIKPTGMKSLEFCEKLLEAQKVAVVPGDAFGEAGEGFIRCSYAYSVEEIKKALDGIKKFLDSVR
jgi:aminotransferase